MSEVQNTEYSRCENCIYWKQYEQSTWGDCVKLDGAIEIVVSANSYDAAEVKAVNTPRSFYCNRWLSKGASE